MFFPTASDIHQPVEHKEYLTQKDLQKVIKYLPKNIKNVL
jgi:hypothetical protein